MNLRDIGWVWEGQGIDPGVHPSIFGVGEGCTYFGLSRAWFLFHPLTELVMNKLAGLEEVISDISKCKFKDTEGGGSDCWRDSSLEAVKSEATLIAQMAEKFPNLTGAVHDDMLGLVQRDKIAPEQYAGIYEALKSSNPQLKLWSVVYSHELDSDLWAGLEPFMDVISLWVWEAQNLPHLDEYIDHCREIFPDKPLHIGCYIRDYPTGAAVPMDLLKGQWECLLRHVEDGTVDGYSILGAVLIDVHQEQVNWVRDFIAANS